MKKSFLVAVVVCLTLKVTSAQNKQLQIEPPKSKQTIPNTIKKTEVTIEQRSPSGTTLSMTPDSLTAFTEGISSTTEIQQLIDSLLQGATDVTKQSSKGHAESAGIGNLNIDPSSVDTITITETEIKNPNAVITKEISSLKKTSPVAASVASSTNTANSEVFANLDSTLLSRFGTSPGELIAQLGNENNPEHSRSVTRHDEAGRRRSATANTKTKTSTSSSRRSSTAQDIQMPLQTVTDIKAIVEATRKQHELDSKLGSSGTSTGVMGEQQVGSIVDKLLKSGKIDTASAAAFRSEPVSIQAINDKGAQSNTLESFLQSTSTSTNEAQGIFDINAELANILDPSFLGSGIFDALGTDQSSIPLTSQLPHTKSSGTTEFSRSSTNTILDSPPSGSQAVQAGSPSINFDLQQVHGNKHNLQFDTSVKTLEDPFQFPNDPALGNSLSVDQGLITDTGNINNGKRAPMTNPGNLNIPESILTNSESKGESRSKVELSTLQAAGVNNPNLGLGADLLQQLSMSNLVDSNTALDPNIFGPSVDNQQNSLEVERQKGLQKLAEIEAKRRIDEQKAVNRLLQTQQEETRLQAERELKANSLLRELAKKQNEFKQKSAIETIKQSNKEQFNLHKLLAEEEKKQNDLNRKALEKHSEISIGSNKISMEEFKRKQLIEEEKRKRDFQEKLKKLRAEAAIEQQKRAERARQKQIELETIMTQSNVRNSGSTGSSTILSLGQNRRNDLLNTMDQTALQNANEKLQTAQRTGRRNIVESVLESGRTPAVDTVSGIQRTVESTARQRNVIDSVLEPTNTGAIIPSSPQIIPLRLSLLNPVQDQIDQVAMDSNALNTVRRTQITTPVEPDPILEQRTQGILRDRNVNFRDTNRLSQGSDARLGRMDFDAARHRDISIYPEVISPVDSSFSFDSSLRPTSLSFQNRVRPMTSGLFRTSDTIRPMTNEVVRSSDRVRPMTNEVLRTSDRFRPLTTRVISSSERVQPITTGVLRSADSGRAMRGGGLGTSSSFYSDFPGDGRDINSLQGDISRDWNRQVDRIFSGSRDPIRRPSRRRMSSGFSRGIDTFYPEVDGLIRPDRRNLDRSSSRRGRVMFTSSVPRRRGRFDRFSGVW